MKKQDKSRAMDRAMECVEAFRTTGTKTDVQGSYTGLYKHSAADAMALPVDTLIHPAGTSAADALAPVQDADDL